MATPSKLKDKLEPFKKKEGPKMKKNERDNCLQQRKIFHIVFVVTPV